MKNIKRILTAVLLFGITYSPVFSETYTDDPPSYYYTQGQSMYKNGQFSSAIKEFKKALRENPSDSSSKIGLINSYISRAEYYNNTEKNPQKALTDLKSAVFYFVCFNGMTDKTKYSNAYNAASGNLNLLEKSLNSDITADGLIKTAKSSRAKGEFAAAGYDFYRALEDSKNAYSANVGLGDVLNILGQTSRALPYFVKAQSINPDNTELQLKLARAYENTNQFAIAAEHYNKALQNSDEKNEILNSLETICRQRADKNPSDAEAHCNLGVIYQKQKKYDLALTEYQKAEKLNPASVTTKINLGLLYFEQRNYRQAIDSFNGVLLIDPKNSNARIQKGRCLEALNINDKAEEEFETALKYEPNNTEAQLYLAELYTKTMNANEAAEKLAQIPNIKISGDFYAKTAYSLHQKGDLENALIYYKKALSKNPDDKSLYLNIAQIYNGKNNLNEAMKYSNDALRLFPNDKQVKDLYKDINARYVGSIYAEAVKLRDSGKYTEAIAAYNRAGVQNYDTFVGIAGVYQLMKDYPNAAAYYKKALNEKPDDEEVSVALAGVLVYADKNAEAEPILKKVIAKNPDNAQAKELLTYVKQSNAENDIQNAVKKFEAKDYKTAESLLTKVISGNPKSYMAYYYRAMVYDALKNYKSAIADYETTIKLEPSTTLVYYSLGVDYDILKNVQKAKDNFKKYLELTKEVNEYTNYAKQRLSQLQSAKQ